MSGKPFQFCSRDQFDRERQFCDLLFMRFRKFFIYHFKPIIKFRAALREDVAIANIMQKRGINVRAVFISNSRCDEQRRRAVARHAKTHQTRRENEKFDPARDVKLYDLRKD